MSKKKRRISEDGDGKRKSNGCTVHFNSILQLLYIYIYIYKPQSINKTLIKLEISKEASFFFYTFVFSFTFEHYKGVVFFFLLFLKSFLLFKLLLNRISAL